MCLFSSQPLFPNLTQDIVECTYTESDIVPGFQYFASKVGCLPVPACGFVYYPGALFSLHAPPRPPAGDAVRISAVPWRRRLITLLFRSALPLPAPQVRLGPNGVEEFLPLGQLSEFEQSGLEKMKGLLTKNIQAGVEFANKA
jgi:hypothetical protein